MDAFFRGCLLRLLEPVAEFCLSRGIHFQDFLEVTKQAFLRAAEKEGKKNGLKQLSVSKLSVMTGLQRPEITRLKRVELPEHSKDFVSRVVSKWSSSRSYLTKSKKPKKLSTEGRQSDFHNLVRSISKDLNPHTVKFELQRLGLAKSDGHFLILVDPIYITTGEPLKTLEFASEDARDLLIACQENALSQSIVPNLHARTQYDNIPDHLIPRVREWVLELGQRIHEECREVLSQSDRDCSPKVSGGGRNRVVVGTFSRVENLVENEEEE